MTASIGPEDVGKPQSTIDRLRAITSLGELVPELIQKAINELEVGAPNACEDALEIYSFATTGALTSPNSQEWAVVVERSGKILTREIARQQG